MTLSSLLYALLFGPLELFFESVFSISNWIFYNPGVSIIALSLVVNILAFPLYKKADELQEEERDREKKMRPWIRHIRKTFKGPERLMMLQAFYRRSHYKPTDALKGAAPLLLQIPFFVAAYHFLSHLSLLAGVSFGPLKDLGAPDGLLTVFGHPVNLLPILMTLINIAASVIYLKGAPLKSKIQLYGIAAIFLILLYSSPSGLVFYWTLNNLFSLLKNVWDRTKPNRFILPSVVSAIGLAIGVLMVTKEGWSLKMRLGGAFMALLFQLPLLFQLARGRLARSFRLPAKDERLFNLGSLFLVLLTGVFIPVNVIQSSPEEFINPVVLNNPVAYVVYSALLAAGTFGIWLRIFYKLTSEELKGLAAYGLWVFSGIAFCDYMLAGGNYGIISSVLAFESEIFSLHDQLKNLVVLAIAIPLLLAVVRYRKRAIVPLYVIVSMAFVVLSTIYIVKIEHHVEPARAKLKEAQKQKAPEFTLSRTGRNVVVLMLDRAINAYIPFIFAEKPELKEKFIGFTLYPNTISFGPATNVGSPPLFGGYEYTPMEMNRRDTVKLEEKHNEALKLMPAIFYTNGYSVTVCNPPYAGYSYPPDLSIYDDYPGLKRYLFSGNKRMLPRIAEESVSLMKDRFFRYSLFRIAPVCLQKRLYANGTYNSLSTYKIHQVSREGGEGHLRADGMPEDFLSQALLLDNLEAFTRILPDPGGNTFTMIDNDTTHRPALLQLPDYTSQAHVDNISYRALYAKGLTVDGKTLRMDNIGHVAHYHVNMAAMIRLGNWFDFLRKEGVYDNTRIILVADHGFPVRQRDDMIFGKEEYQDAMGLNPLLLVKDFDSRSFSVDNTFMTNGDVPTLAFRGLIENPVNPFTGKVVNDAAKHAGPQRILVRSAWHINLNNGTKYLPGIWLEVKNDIFDMKNWKTLGPSLK